VQILLGQAVMRAIAGGLSAGGSLALAHHFLSLVEPRVDPLAVCSHLHHGGLDWPSFSAGIVAGVFLVVFIQTFVTLRWAFAELVAAHLGARGGEAPPRKVLYKLL